MQQQRQITLNAIFSDVLSSLAFMLNDDGPIKPIPGAQWLEASISYYGPFNGTLFLRTCKGFSIELAANLLGVDPGDEAAEIQAEDAITEFMNIICGQFITTWYGSEQTFNLSIPTMRALPEFPHLDVADNEELVTMSVEGHPVQLAHVGDSNPV
jgi:hypothetical protein